MASLYDYAALSALVYNFGNDRGNLNRLSTPVLAGWTQLEIPSANNSLTGFAAAAYQNTATREIVIAYKGTDFFSTFKTPTGNLDWSRIFATGSDFLFGNSAAFGVVNNQIYQAAQFYQQIKNQSAFLWRDYP